MSIISFFLKKQRTIKNKALFRINQSKQINLRIPANNLNCGIKSVLMTKNLSNYNNSQGFLNLMGNQDNLKKQYKNSVSGQRILL